MASKPSDLNQIQVVVVRVRPDKSLSERFHL